MTVMNIEKFKTSGEWYRQLKKDGYVIPLSLFHALNKLISDENITFQEAYEELANQGKIQVVEKTINFDLWAIFAKSTISRVTYLSYQD